MKVLFYYRNPKIAFSIGKVFKIIENEISKNNSVNSLEMTTIRSTPFDVIRNCKKSFKYRDLNSINHITGHIHEVALALIGVKSVLTIHDLVFIDNVKNPFKCFYKWLFWLYLPVKIVDQVTVSYTHLTLPTTSRV